MITSIGVQQSPTFKSLNICESALEYANKSKINNSKFMNIKNAIVSNKLDRKRNIDVILDYEKETDKFYGVISSKKQGVPNIQGNSCYITENKRDISNFKKWVNAWNKAYSKKELEIKNKILSMISNK